MEDNEYKFSINDELNKKLNEAFNNNSWEIYRIMGKWFGEITMSQVSKKKMDEIYDVVAFIVSEVCSGVESHYIHKSFETSQQSSINVLNAALAGAALKNGE